MSGISDTGGAVAGRTATVRPDEKKNDHGAVPADASPGAAADAAQAKDHFNSKE